MNSKIWQNGDVISSYCSIKLNNCVTHQPYLSDAFYAHMDDFRNYSTAA